MKLFLTVLVAGILISFMPTLGHALSPNMGEDSQSYCNRCRTSGIDCTCYIGPIMENWDCKCKGISRASEKKDSDAADSEKSDLPDKNSQPATFMETVQKNINMPDSTGLGMEADRPASNGQE